VILVLDFIQHLVWTCAIMTNHGTLHDARADGWGLCIQNGIAHLHVCLWVVGDAENRVESQHGNL